MKNKNVLINDFTDYQLYKLPMLKDDEYIHHSNTYLIGIIDASGSMLSIWSQVVKFWNSLCLTLERTSESKLAVTFDHKKKFTEYDLTENISEWGGGQTNIMGAFSLLEKVIDDKLYDDSNYFDKFDSASIIFISDGEDSSSTEDVVNKMKYLNKFTCFKTINFITIGIGHEFPTFLAMDLRIFYHNGINEIPPLYLIENDDDFDKIKSSIVNLLVHEQKKKLVVSPKSLFIPWEPLKEEFLAFSKCIENNSTPLVTLDDGFKALQVANEIIEKINI